MKKLFIVIPLFLLLGCEEDSTEEEQQQHAQCCSSPNFSYSQDSLFIFIPNAFTPNYSGINDVFGIFTIGAQQLHWVVINGSDTLFETQNPGDEWDGKENGVESPSGTYDVKFSITLTNGFSIDTTATVCLLPRITGGCIPDTIEMSSCLFGNQFYPWVGFDTTRASGETICP